MASKALITGGAGFIGSHLAERLKRHGRQVVIVDDLSTGRRENVEPLLDDTCRLVVGRAGAMLNDSDLIDGVDEVYHLAAAVGVKLVVENPTAMVRTNIDETLAVLGAARRAGAAVLIASSSEVYGKATAMPLREDADLHYGPTTAARWSYGMTKALDEHLALDEHRRSGLPVVVARLFNTVGPRQVGRYGMVVPRFVSSAARNRPIEVYGDGRQTRSFCDVRDVVRAMTALLEAPACRGRVYNLGADRPVTINALAEQVIALTGSSAGVRHVPCERVYGPGFEEPPQRVPDVTRLREAIAFEPRYALEQTLRELIAIERRSLRNQDAAATLAEPAPPTSDL